LVPETVKDWDVLAVLGHEVNAVMLLEAVMVAEV
jgi:hypothetical protein